MRPTRLWRWIAATAGGLVLVGGITVRITPAAIGLAALVYLVHTRLSARQAFQEAQVRVERRVLADTVHKHAPVEVVLDSEDSRLPWGVRLRIEDEPPPEARPREADPHPFLHGPTRRAYTIEAQGTGTLRWEQVTVRLGDARGLWVHEEPIPLETETRVLPSKERLQAGRRLAKRNPLEAQQQDQRGTVMKELEFESLREFQPSDRLRDVDWKRYSRLQELVTREFEREREAPVVFLVDAGRTMRQRSGRDASNETKLDFASDVLLELAESASAQGHAVGMIAFDELHVLETQQPSEHREAPSRLAELVSDLPGRVRARRRLDVGLPDEAPVDETELDALEKLIQLRGAAAQDTGEQAPSTPSPSQPQTGTGTGFQQAIRRIVAQVGANRVAVIALTDLERFPDEAVRTLGRLSSRGHRVLVGVLPGSWFLDPPEQVRARDLENAYKEIETRRRVRRLLAARGVQVTELGPWSPAAAIAEQTGEPSTRSRGAGQQAPSGPSQTPETSHEHGEADGSDREQTAEEEHTAEADAEPDSTDEREGEQG